MKRDFSVIIEKDSEGYLVASVPELKGCHTQAKSMDELLERIHEAILVCLEDSPPADSPEFLGLQRISVDLWPAPHV